MQGILYMPQSLQTGSSPPNKPFGKSIAYQLLIILLEQPSFLFDNERSFNSNRAVSVVKSLISRSYLLLVSYFVNKTELLFTCLFSQREEIPERGFQHYPSLRPTISPVVSSNFRFTDLDFLLRFFASETAEFHALRRLPHAHYHHLSFVQRDKHLLVFLYRPEQGYNTIFYLRSQFNFYSSNHAREQFLFLRLQTASFLGEIYFMHYLVICSLWILICKILQNLINSAR